MEPNTMPTNPALDLSVLRREACRRTGLSEFGERWFEQPLQMLLDALNREAQLSAAGHGIHSERIIALLSTRLRIRAALVANPQILELPVSVAGVIVGLPRSGSTLLHRMLSAASTTNCIYWWETLNPVPLPGETPGEPSARKEAARAAVDHMLTAMPALGSIHPMDPLAPDEEVMLLDLSFISSTPESIAHVPSYGRWLEACDQTPAYQELRQILQLLTWQDPARSQRRWILKTPHHLTGLRPLLETFPGSRIIMTHRDPVATTPSWCSLVATLSAPATEHLDPARIGRHWSARLARSLNAFIAARRELGEQHFIDVRYEALTHDAVAESQRVLGELGLPSSADELVRLQGALQRNARERRAPHRYTAAEFGLSDEAITSGFCEYRSTFLDPQATGLFR